MYITVMYTLICVKDMWFCYVLCTVCTARLYNCKSIKLQNSCKGL